MYMAFVKIASRKVDKEGYENKEKNLEGFEHKLSMC